MKTAKRHHRLREGRLSLPGHCYFITVCCHGRLPHFRDMSAARAVSRSLATVLNTQASTILAWVLMPDHYHLLLQLGDGDQLPVVMNRINSCTAKAANTSLSRIGKVWQGAYYDKAIRNDEQLGDFVRYLLDNPLRAGLVDRLGDYPYWNIEFAEANEELLAES